MDIMSVFVLKVSDKVKTDYEKMLKNSGLLGK